MTPPVLTDLVIAPIVAMAQIERMHCNEIPALLISMLASSDGAHLYMNQFQLFTIAGNPNFALEMQAKALETETLYRIEGPEKPAIRLLALMGQGDTTDNTPLDYLIENSDIRLDLLYVLPGHPLPDMIPDHDVAITALGVSDKNRATLEWMEQLTASWPRPLLNIPSRILNCERDSVYQLLKATPGLVIPPTLHTDRDALMRVAAAKMPISEAYAGIDYPATVRPLDSQSGHGLCKIDNQQQLAAYLSASTESEFYISSYIDYRSPDGLFRKARIALIAGHPYICHLGISDDWIVHYKSAGMDEHADRRAEEEHFTKHFDTGFAQRHGKALRDIAERSGLDYVVIDCAETQNGTLLIFEIDNRGWVHATDHGYIFQYKQEYMKKAFVAFRAMLLNAMTPLQEAHSEPAAQAR
jgi:glutathione synthase/RimK-type ligase-like ATP-grasp enzyme